MEIFTSREGEILLKKYSPVGELSEFAVGVAESIAQTIGELVCVTDRDYVIATAGAGKKEFEGRLLDAQMQAAIDQRMSQVVTGDKSKFIKITSEDEKAYERQTVVTILSNGDSIGSVIIISKEKNNNSEDALLQIAKTVATFLGKHIEQ